jgi:phosphate acetyltransferase
MTPGVYVAGCEPATGKSAVALGVQQLLARRVERLGVFRPVVVDRERDPLIDLLRPEFLPYEASCGVGYEDVRADEPRALEEIVARYRALAAQCDGVLVVGTDFLGAGTASELAFNARVALNLGLPVLCVVSGHLRTAAEVQSAVSVAINMMRRIGPEVVAVVANRVRPDEVDAVVAEVSADVPVYVLHGGRPADGSDDRRGAGRVRRRAGRRQPGGARPRGPRHARRGDDGAEPARAAHRRRAGDHAWRPC